MYRWTDENGKLHFSDRPAAQAGTEIETIEVEGPDLSGDDAARRHRRNQRRIDAYEEVRQERDAERAEAAKVAAQHRENCEIAKRNQFRFEHAGRIASVDKNGERRVLEGAEYDRVIAHYRAATERWCGAP